MTVSRFDPAVGSLHDLSSALDRVLLWTLPAIRLVVLAVAGAFGLLLGLDGLALVVLLAMSWVLALWPVRFAFPIVAVVLGVVTWYEHSSALTFLSTAAVVSQLRLVRSFLRIGALPIRSVDSPSLFLGRHFLFRALSDRTAASVLLAIDKATCDDRARAAIFIDDCFDRVPVHLQPVLVQCQALVKVGELEFPAALLLSERARELAADAPEEIRGWCALQAGDVLLAAGQLAAAEARWQESLELLRRRRRTRYWATQAELRLIEALTADLADADRCRSGLKALCQVRRSAVRAGNLELLSKAELQLLRLMHRAGNTVGVVKHLEKQCEQTEGRVVLGASVADHATEALLLASLYLDMIENPTRYPDSLRGVDSERYADIADLAECVLRQLSRSTKPLLEAQAFAILARVQSATDRPEAALGNVLKSLNIVQQVRCRLPTARWRTQWLAAHAHTYALALDLASKDDPTLVAELLETIRSQSVPLESARSGGLVRSVFDSMLAITGLPLATAVPGDAGPIVTDDRTILVAGASWVGGDERNVISLDDEIESMVPGGWYWSFAKVSGWVYHAIRTPQGQWHAQRRPAAELDGPFEELTRHLHSELPGEEDPAVWAHIFERLGAALLPSGLLEALRAADDPIRLVVAPTASLVMVPVWALPIGSGRRVLDSAYISHLPAGAHGWRQQVFCKLFAVPDTEHTARIDRALADSMRYQIDPARALRAVQRTELDRWLNGRASVPLVFLAYAYVGLGQPAAPDLGQPELIDRSPSWTISRSS
ncbi:MAG: hypothetical protein QOG10_2346 [Kribbellaceae bacterium]|nr:hypothetical protein [Kribbellaceae bacterium]